MRTDQVEVQQPQQLIRVVVADPVEDPRHLVVAERFMYVRNARLGRRGGPSSDRAAFGMNFTRSPSDSRYATPRSTRCGQFPMPPKAGDTTAAKSPACTRGAITRPSGRSDVNAVRQ
jgi:hypothetical protein